MHIILQARRCRTNNLHSERSTIFCIYLSIYHRFISHCRHHKIDAFEAPLPAQYTHHYLPQTVTSLNWDERCRFSLWRKKRGEGFESVDLIYTPIHRGPILLKVLIGVSIFLIFFCPPTKRLGFAFALSFLQLVSQTLVLLLEFCERLSESAGICTADSSGVVRPHGAGTLRRNIFRDLWLLARLDVERHDHAQGDVLLHVTVELPHAGHVGLEADHRPRPLPDLEAILAQGRLEVLGLLVLLLVVGATPIQGLKPSRVVRVSIGPVLRRAWVEELGHKEARGFVDVAPLEVRNVDNLEKHAVHMDVVRRGREVVEHDLHGLRILRDV
mmetsp:Transcript_31119/g.58007  ORF Transcript_31119/g.58007 Transcript_31119/m.58007 type:complete len:328 (+) Transcript_31119:43-1026(+)